MILVAVHDFGLCLNNRAIRGFLNDGAWFGASLRCPAEFTGGFDGQHGTACASVIAHCIAHANSSIRIVPVGISPTHEPQTLTASLCWAAANSDIVLTAWTTDKWLADQSLIERCFNDGRQGKGTLWIGAVGNQARSNVSFPARFDRCIGVGSLTDDLHIADYCNQGPGLDLLAPGVANAEYIENASQYSRSATKLPPFHGTSASAALVAAVAAQVLNEHPQWTEPQVREHLCRSLATLHPQIHIPSLKRESLPRSIR